MEPIALYDRKTSKKLDSIAVAEFAISIAILMERAGAAAFAVLKEHWPQARQLAIFCGIGNNGGDGYVVARLAKLEGYQVTIYQLGDISKLSEAALQARAGALAVGVEAVVWEYTTVTAEVIVDAIFGIGLNAPLTGLWLAAVEYINSTNIPVLALDIPTGLDADTGAPLNAAVYSTITVTFIGNKQGMFTGKARDYCGEISFSSLAVPSAIYDKVSPTAVGLSFASIKSKLPIRTASSHKGNFGQVFVIGGGPGMSGAVRMAGEAALRVGAGLVSVITHPMHADHITAARPELISIGVEDSILELLEQAVAKKAVILLGPGLGMSPWARKIFQEVLPSKLPMVIDADGLNLLAEQETVLTGNWVLTPHPGEAARLLNTSIPAIEADRFQALTALQKKFSSTIVLKGAGSLITYQNKIGVCDAGNVSMASAGMGDILAGMIAGLWAQHVTAEDAATLGVCLHAAVGDLVAGAAKCGVLATDLLATVTEFFREQ